MVNCLSDLLHAARTLVRARAFTAVCVISLGLGMGVVIAILLLMRMVLGTPPGVNDDGLVELVIRPSGQLRAQAGPAIIDTWSLPGLPRRPRRRQRHGHHRLEPRRRPLSAAQARGAAISVPTMYVSSNYFSTIGVTLPLGPGFTPVDDASRAEPEAVIGHRVWQLRFGSDPDIIGRTITDQPDRLRRRRRRAGEFPRPRGRPERQLLSALAAALAPSAPDWRAESARFARDAAWVRILARLPEGTTVAQADAIVQSADGGAGRALSRRPTATRPAASSRTFPPGRGCGRRSTFARLMLLGLSGMVLLVVGLNISGMMLVRSAMRERELAVRLAMGASRWRLMRYHLSEALVMAVFGGSLASALLFGGAAGGRVGVRLLGTGARSVQARSVAGAAVHRALLRHQPRAGAAAGASLQPARDPLGAQERLAGSGQRVGRLQRFTAAAQAGLAVPFLVIGGVKLDQARVTAFADVGFKPQGLYAARLNLPRDRQDRRRAAAVRADGAGEPRAGAGRRLGQRRRRRAARLHLSQRARRARGRRRLRRRAHDARRPRATSRRSAPACSPAARSTPTIATARNASCCCPSRWRGSCSPPAIRSAARRLCACRETSRRPTPSSA